MTQVLDSNRITAITAEQTAEDAHPTTGLFTVNRGVNIPFLNLELNKIDNETINPLNQSVFISKLVGAESKVTFESNLTYHPMLRTQYLLHNRVFGTVIKTHVVDTFAITSGTIALTVALPQALIASRSIVFLKGLGATNPDGVYLASASAQTTTSMSVAGITAQATVPNNAEIHYCGIKGASGDIAINASGNITSTVLDFTTVPFIKVGSILKIGGGDTVGSLGGAASRFATAGNNGLVRVLAVSANLLTVSKILETNLALAVDAGTGKTIELYSALIFKLGAYNDATYLAKRIAIETYDPAIDAYGGNPYNYGLNGAVSSITLDFNNEEFAKITTEVSFGKIETNVATGSRKAGYSTAVVPVDAPTFVPKLAAKNAYIRIGGLIVTELQDVSLKMEQELNPVIYQGIDTPAVVNATQNLANIFPRTYNDKNKVMVTLDINAISTGGFNAQLNEALKDSTASVLLQYDFPQELRNTSNLAASSVVVEISSASFDTKNEPSADDIQKTAITVKAASSSDPDATYITVAYFTYFPYTA